MRKNGNIVIEFDIRKPGKHHILTEEALVDLKKRFPTNGIGLLISVFGESAVFGLIVRAHRLKNGLQTKDLAKKCDFSTAMINRIENGMRLPTADQIRSLDTALPGLKKLVQTMGLIDKVG